MNDKSRGFASAIKIPIESFDELDLRRCLVIPLRRLFECKEVERVLGSGNVIVAHGGVGEPDFGQVEMRQTLRVPNALVDADRRAIDPVAVGRDSRSVIQAQDWSAFGHVGFHK